MGSFSSKDSHGISGNHLDSFHTPPASPQSDEPGFVPGAPQLLPPTSPKSPCAVLSSPPVSVLASSSVKRSHPSSAIPSPEWRPPPPRLSSNRAATLSAVSPVPTKPESTLAVKGHITLGRNEAPSTSTPQSGVSQGKCMPVSPTTSSSTCSSSPAVCSSSGPKWRERDSGLSHSLLPGPEARDVQSEELTRLLDEWRTTLGTSERQDGPTDVIAMLKHLQAEVKNLKSAMQSERTEWLQFQADLQVAVSVADRLRAEAEEELTALQTAHKDVERELAAALHRRKEADMQLVTLRGELEESRQRLATLSQTPDKTNVQEGEKTEALKNSDSGEGSQRGRERGVYRVAGSSNDTVKSVVREDCVAVTKQYLRNVTNEGRRRKEVRLDEAQRTATTERSRSLSRLPAYSDSLTLQNGTSQSTTSTTPESANKNLVQFRGRRCLDQEESRSNADSGKREETLNKYNSTLSDLPSTRSQDGFNLLLRRHGGSKRNSLLRWCQSQTQGYQNIDITNFSSSWVDGLAFCAVYHTYLPSHIPYSSLSPDNKRHNLSLAFKTGETVGIAQSLTVDDMLRAGGPDWQRVLSYVESMYRHFEM
ncbi:cytospin-A [Phycodurus eques]|uniref:cytospin-A n=1 Tax=Phycodurus eques TaxID=693459 RepID=UPI002ACDF330|nr:cytospin-A [Phycodurus eques]XP_061553103.1 cytospin-A [Phycodurus eques]XP_061553104.1 cytospin-A [Phycodurus eques]XP_061553105.1 cytospin-A [Phycodurus eques]XP_061553106.1 cytospin-A [Phycodurus eques]